MKVYSFEKLLCWQHAKQLALWVYKITQLFPLDEKFGLVSQMRRASISIASNIAEGSSRKSMNDQAHFSTIAYSSTIELLNQLILVNELNFISRSQYEEGREIIEKQTFLISKLRASQLSNNTKPSKLSKPSKPN